MVVLHRGVKTVAALVPRACPESWARWPIHSTATMGRTKLEMTPRLNNLSGH